MDTAHLPPLLTWTSPEKTGMVFGPVFLVLISLAYNSLISVIAYTALTALCVIMSCKAYVYIMVTLLKKLPDQPSSDPLALIYRLDLEIPADKVVNISALATDIVNSGVSELRRLFLAENLIDSAKFGISLYCLTYIGSWFNLLTLLIFAWVAAFTLPKLYINNQVVVDELLEKVKIQSLEMKEKVVSMLPASAKPAPVEVKKEE